MRQARRVDLDRGVHVCAPNPPYLYRMRAAGQDVGLSPRSIWGAVQAGEIEAFRFGCSKTVLLRPEAVRAWAEARLRPYRTLGVGASGARGAAGAEGRSSE